MQKSNITDNTGTKPSPCRICPNHLAGVDKKLCLDGCQRLIAYQQGKDWTNKPVEIIEINTLDEEFEEFKDSLKEPISECLISDCEEEDIVRGLCQIHYDAWRNGSILHPVLGKFKVVRPIGKREEETVGRKKKKEEIRVDSSYYTVELAGYPKIRKVLLAMSQDLSLPVEHLIITLIGEAFARRNRKNNSTEG